MIRNNNYVLTIILYPFMLLVGYLWLNKAIDNKYTIFLVLAMFTIFVPSFIMTLYGVSEEIFASKRKWRIVFLLLFSVFYLPIYYTNNISKERVFGIFVLLIDLIASFYFYNTARNKLASFFNSIYENSVIINDHLTYTSVNKLFSFSVDNSYRCVSNMGDYVVSCDRNIDDSFIGIYSYDITDMSEEEINDLFEFHLNQTISYIEESLYTPEVDNNGEVTIINYNDMSILFTQRNYLLEENYSYSLIIIKELPKEDLDFIEFQKMIESITFFPYNNDVSS